jgi:hypothetical protein
MIRWRLQHEEWHSSDGTWRVYLDVHQAEGRPQWHAAHCGKPLLRKNGQIGYWADPGGARRAAERFAETCLDGHQDARARGDIR